MGISFYPTRKKKKANLLLLPYTPLRNLTLSSTCLVRFSNTWPSHYIFYLQMKTCCISHQDWTYTSPHWKSGKQEFQYLRVACHSHYAFQNKSNSTGRSPSFQMYTIIPWRKCSTIKALSCPYVWKQEASSSRTCEMSSSGMTDAGITGCGWLPSSPDPLSRPVRITLVCLRESRAPADDLPEDPPPLPPTPELQRLLKRFREKHRFYSSVFGEISRNMASVLLRVTCRQSLKNTGDWLHRQMLWKSLSKLVIWTPG